MRSPQSRIIGIVGGMGPRAGLALYENILLHTPAVIDQEHLSVVLMTFPGNIEDRTLFLEGKVSNSPAYGIVEVIRKLVKSGASLIGIACNTSHAPAIFDVITAEVSKMKNPPILLNMPEEVCKSIRKNHPGISRIGLMTTNGTYSSGLYRHILEAMGYEVIVPDYAFQDQVIHRMVYDPEIGIKANPVHIPQKIEVLCQEAISYFRERNAEAIVLGCTEFSLLLKEPEMDGIQLIDSTKCLAMALIKGAVAPTLPTETHCPVAK
ncbi:aspartate/glutamate racemase family protein [Chitinophaga sp.]|uniref:aspartate/glutamate racemase family protein n=1 Tax=Chitinophaga sp. TaxID=1869181 RepID=UPI002F936124